MKSSARIGFAFIFQLALSSTALAEGLEGTGPLPNLVLLPVENEQIARDLREGYRSVIAESLGKEYNIFTGSNVDEMLEAEFEKQCKIYDDADAASSECVQNVAGELNADLVALPKIIQTEEGYLVTLEISDVFTEQLITTYSETCVGCSPLELTNTFRNMIENADAVAQCTVSVRTKPFISDGQISIDGKQSDVLTPAVLKLDLGQYVLSIKSDDYFGETTLDCASETILQLEVSIALISASSTVDDDVSSANSSFEVKRPTASGLSYGGWYTQMDFTGVMSDDSRSNEDGIDGTDLGKISQRGSRLGFEMGYFQGIGLALRMSGIVNTYSYQSRDPNTYEPEEASVNGLGAGLYLYLTRWLSLGTNQVFLSEEVAFSTINYSPGIINESIVAINITSAYGSFYVFGFELISRSEELDSGITQSNSNLAVKFGYRFD